MTKKMDLIKTNSEYKQFVIELKNKIRQSQLKATVKVNYELLNLYWELGANIVEMQKEYSWGESFLKELSKDLKKEFPNMKGFSAQNLKHIRYWYRFYNDYLIGLQAVTQMDNEKGQQLSDQIENLVKQIPWGHNQRIMYKCRTVEEALFYVAETIENGWSRTVLECQIELNLFGRQGKAITNFDNKLTKLQSDLAKETLKDPYNFDFLSIREDYDERELEYNLVSHITEFLLELGTGFSYIGRQVPIHVGESDFLIDLLFYHVKLHCYVVVELKAKKFKSEYLGQLNFYVTAVNKDIKAEQDNPTIGLLICKDKDDVVCECSLESIEQPIGVSRFEISEFLGDEFKGSLPSIEEIEQVILE